MVITYNNNQGPWISSIDNSIIDGLILGDASIDSRSPSFRFVQSYEHKASFPMGIRQMFIDHGIQCNFHQGLTKPNGVLATHIWTLTSEHWKRERVRWYPNGIKVVPDDIRITPASLLMFFLCDGCLSYRYMKRNGEQGGPLVTFATCSFTVDDIEKLSNRMRRAIGLSGRFHVTTRHELRLTRMADVADTMHYMLKGGNIPSGYEYKFRGFLQMQVNETLVVQEDCRYPSSIIRENV